MSKWMKSKLNLKADFYREQEYKKCISDLIEHDLVWSMKKFIQHSDINCLEHSFYVSYCSYLVCMQLGFDYCSAARGGLLHDFFLYDWHIEKPYKGMHGFIHPFIAFENANKYFYLNKLEKDIIQKHMWPLSIRLPRYRESFVVAFVDKYCAFMEIINFGRKKSIYRLINKIGI